MDVKKLFLGLLTATVALAPFATIQPASAGLKRSNSNAQTHSTISKDRLSHPAKVVTNNPDKKISTKIDLRKQMQYKQDGKTFKNKEHKLPTKGKYTEHTVPPLTGHHRGAERIVKDAQGNKFHTKDHYNTFKKVTELQRRNSH